MGTFSNCTAVIHLIVDILHRSLPSSTRNSPRPPRCCWSLALSTPLREFSPNVVPVDEGRQVVDRSVDPVGPVERRGHGAVMARVLAVITRWGIDTHPFEHIRRPVDPGADVHR